MGVLDYLADKIAEKVVEKLREEQETGTLVEEVFEEKTVIHNRRSTDPDYFAGNQIRR